MKKARSSRKDRFKTKHSRKNRYRRRLTQRAYPSPSWSDPRQRFERSQELLSEVQSEIRRLPLVSSSQGDSPVFVQTKGTKTTTELENESDQSESIRPVTTIKREYLQDTSTVSHNLGPTISERAPSRGTYEFS